jgi:electron transfer flavoprotein beta subunit
MQAKRKSISIIPIEELQLKLTPHLKILKVTTPEKRRSGIKVESVKELVKRLKQEAQVIS